MTALNQNEPIRKIVFKPSFTVQEKNSLEMRVQRRSQEHGAERTTHVAAFTQAFPDAMKSAAVYGRVFEYLADLTLAYEEIADMDRGNGVVGTQFAYDLVGERLGEMRTNFESAQFAALALQAHDLQETLQHLEATPYRTLAMYTARLRQPLVELKNGMEMVRRSTPSVLSHRYA